ncbi:hypothetical protein BDA96_03G182800 [Sorghum bicolor]|uniref:Uncharacterized protein n=1 Tax=Sorghum bicolor TaxID=4558 RepID=A0A921RD56_SORBI|nr:hypothetical protein BDA96_03G179100 [Sorghum bicolor]KAG0537828.1 hypothetical protein BDA96_03G182200 [Sorghum bicolor]KAG0537834.1 hypothetical protein BDA96_03G182800 [Sorghum bicolor]
MFLMSNQTKKRGERYHSNVVSGCLSPCSWISNFLECSKFHLSIQVWINTSKNISEQGSSAMPNVSEKEEQSKGSMTKSEPTPWTAAKNTI